MWGQLTSKQESRNKVSAVWTFYPYNDIKDTSPSFPLSTGEHHIAFVLSVTINKQDELSVIVQKCVSIAGRAIITLEVCCKDGSVHRVATCLQENWETDCSFARFITVPSPRLNFVITCRVTWLGFNDQNNSLIPRYSDFLPTFSFEQNYMSDVILFVENQEISAHKVILAAHSPVLLAMFNTEMKESKENRVVIEDVAHPIVEILCRIMYKNDTNDLNDVEIALKTLAAAEKYQMESIKKICEYKLQMMLNKNNAVQILNEADMHNANELCCTVVEYIIAAEGKIISKPELMAMCREKRNISDAFIKTQMCKVFKEM